MDKSFEEVLMVKVQTLPRLSADVIQGTARLRLPTPGKSQLANFVTATLEGDHTHALDLGTLRLLQGKLLEHSELTAILAQLIATEVKFPDPAVAFTTGLFHDIGEAVLNAYAFDDIAEVLKLTQTKAMEAWVAEDRRLGFNHAYFGGKVLARWGLPPEIVAATRYHHRPIGTLARIVHVADVAASCHTTRVPLGIRLFPLDENALSELGLTKDRLASFTRQAAEIFERIG